MKKSEKKKSVDGLREHPTKGFPLQDNHLESVLKRLFPNDNDWVYHGTKTLKDSNGKSVKTDSGHTVKPDFVSKKRLTIIEFDGAGGKNPYHYSSDAQCIRDQEKDALYNKLGYKVVRIPMYVQLDSEMIDYYFGIKYDQDLYEACHCHGFSHESILLPAAFSQLGLERFRREFQKLPETVKRVIVQSLKGRIEAFMEKDNYSYNDAKRMVIPPALDDIISIE